MTNTLQQHYVVIETPGEKIKRDDAIKFRDDVLDVWLRMTVCRPNIERGAMPLADPTKKFVVLPAPMHKEVGELYVERAAVLGLAAMLVPCDDMLNTQD